MALLGPHIHPATSVLQVIAGVGEGGMGRGSNEKAKGRRSSFSLL